MMQTGERSEVEVDFDGGNETGDIVSEPTPFDEERFNRSFSRKDTVHTSKPISCQEGVSFEEKVLRELSNLKRSQKSFENRIEKKIQTFMNDQSTNMRSNSKPIVHGGDQSHTGFQSCQYGKAQVRYRDQAPERYVDDFDDFEELDENFPLNTKTLVEELEHNIRKNLEFKFLLNSRLNELGAKSYKKCIRLKMEYLFTNPVLEKYTWCGTEKKRPFKKFKAINNLILRSVRDRCPNTRKDEYKDYMMIWLKHAKSRQRKVTYSYPSRGNVNHEDSSADSEDENF